MLRDESKSYPYKLSHYLAVRCKTRDYNDSRELARQSLAAFDFALSIPTIEAHTHYVPMCEVNMLFKALNEATSEAIVEALNEDEDQDAPESRVDALLGLFAPLTVITIQRSPESKLDLLQKWRQIIKLMCERQFVNFLSMYLDDEIMSAIGMDQRRLIHAIGAIIADDSQLEKLIKCYCQKREFPFAKRDVKLRYLQKQYFSVDELTLRSKHVAHPFNVSELKKYKDELSTVLSQTRALQRTNPDYRIPIETLKEVWDLIFRTYSDEKDLDVRIHTIYDLLMQYQHTEYQEMAAITLMQVYCDSLVQFRQNSIIEIPCS